MNRLVVLISGNGTNLQALIDACASGRLPAKIALVVSNRKAAFGLSRAHQAGIPTLTLGLKAYKDQGKSRQDYDADMAKLIQQHLDTEHAQKTIIVLAGWMHILSDRFLNAFPPGSVINLHPALPGQFDGANAIERAHEAFTHGQITHTGVMVHRVIAKVDAGEVLLSRTVPMEPGITLAQLEDKIHVVEHELIVLGAIEAYAPKLS
jgi:formyltetrahydrofolate-dependent phosphoribosylglycinamide formyltransferase